MGGKGKSCSTIITVKEVEHKKYGRLRKRGNFTREKKWKILVEANKNLQKKVKISLFYLGSKMCYV